MQNAGLAALGLNWRYLAFDVQPEHLAPVIAGAKLMRFIGLNLTVPHKLLAFQLMDELDESAKTWGAVNTIRFEGKDPQGRWRPLAELDETGSELRTHGFNTDADAIVRALQEDLGFRAPGAKVLLLGAGGAGRTAALRLAAEGVAELFLVNRTQSKAEAVAQEIRERFPAVRVAARYPSRPVDLIVNATSLGLKNGDPLPLAPDKFHLRQARAAYDMIYRPATTPFLAAAKHAGCRLANGLSMLLYQGVKALEIWTGKPAPVALMRAALEKNVYG